MTATPGRKPSIRQVLSPLFACVEALGFEKRGLEYVRHVRGPLWEGIEFGTSAKGGDFHVSPVIGICHQGALEIEVRCDPEPRGRFSRDDFAPMVRRALRHAIPGEPLVGFAAAGACYRVPREVCPPELEEQFCDELQTYGLPWMARLHGEEEFLSAIRSPESPLMCPLRDLWLPATLAAMGRADECRRTLKELQSSRQRILWYPQFAENLLRYLDDRGL